MRIEKIILSMTLCLGAAGCKETKTVASVENPSHKSSEIIPLPEAEESNYSDDPIDTIVVDKNGAMEETQYDYDPDQGGVVINNYEEISGNGASLFFPALEVGMLWWGGYWVDNNGNYWNGHRYEHVNHADWDSHWNNYWHNDWNNKWNHYKASHPNGGDRNRNFNHHNGMNRPLHQGSHGGGRR